MHGTAQRKRRRYYPFRRRTKPGAAPGTIAVDPQAHPTGIDLFAYRRDAFLEERNVDVESVRGHVGHWPVVWVNVEGLADATVVRAIGELFSLHPLALEDVVNVHQRPKVDAYDGQLFIVSRMVTVEHDEIETEQLSMFVGTGFVVTFQERPGDVLDPVRERIRAGAQLRGLGPDYLA